MNEKALYDLKYTYNYYLSRFNKGCDYCEKHIDEIDKWHPKIVEYFENLNLILEEIMKYIEVTQEEILYGFNIQEDKENGM